MKRLKFMMGGVALALALTLITGCNFTDVEETVDTAEDSSTTTSTDTKESDVEYEVTSLTFDDSISDYITTIDDIECIDVNKSQSTTTWDAEASVIWDNPLYNAEGLEGFTFSFDLYNKETNVNDSYDSLLTFFPSTIETDSKTWGGSIY